jgi:thymidylate synthase (FAD)
MISGKKVEQEDSGLSKREWNELMEKLDRKDLIIN